MCPTLALPIGPTLSSRFARVGTRRVFQSSIPSHSEISVGRSEAFFSPRKGMLVACCHAIFSRQFWRWRPWRDASLVRTKCRLGGIDNNKILPEWTLNHKVILDATHDYSPFIFNWLCSARDRVSTPRNRPRCGCRSRSRDTILGAAKNQMRIGIMAHGRSEIAPDCTARGTKDGGSSWVPQKLKHAKLGLPEL
jgi:hypothetical protein